MKKSSKIVCLILAAIIIIFSIVLMVGKKLWTSVVSETHLVLTNAEDYQGRKKFFEEEYVGYWSRLLIFPENNAENINIEKYYYERDYLSLDPIYKIVLIYTMNEEEYGHEKERLATISVTENGNVQKISYISDGFQYPAYVAAYEKGRVYEYALTDDNERRIICIYYQMEELDEDTVGADYMPTRDIINDQGFSIYSL